MNVTGFIKTPEFKERINKSTISWAMRTPSGKLLAPPPNKEREHEVATAFHYLMNFHVEYLNRGKKIHKRKWMSTSWLEQNSSLISEEYTPKDDEEKKVVKFYKYLNDNYQKLIPVYERYIIEGEITDELLYFCLLLSKIEAEEWIYKKIPVKYSNLRIPLFYTEPSPESIADLKNLHNLINPNDFRCYQKCYLNPVLSGREIYWLRDSFADLIIDDTLIEIKIYKEITQAKFKSHIHQLLVYFLMSLVGQINPKRRKPLSEYDEYRVRIGELNLKPQRNQRSPIKYFGIYYARQGIYWKQPIAAVLNTDNYFREYERKFPFEKTDYTGVYYPDEFKSVRDIQKDPEIIELKKWFLENAF